MSFQRVLFPIDIFPVIIVYHQHFSNKYYLPQMFL